MKKNLIGLAVGLAVLLVAAGVLASNMGFKLAYVLDAKGNNGSASGTNSVALPYNQQTSLVNASDLRADIIAASGESTAVTSISRFLRGSDALASYTGASTADDFALIPGEGYRVQLNTTVTEVVLIIVGSHDPGKVVTLDAKGNNGSASGTNDFAYPYHSVAATASDLRDELIATSGVSTAVTSISKFLRGSDALASYTGASTADDFPLVPGESYRIQLNTTVTQIDYVPSHY